MQPQFTRVAGADIVMKSSPQFAFPLNSTSTITALVHYQATELALDCGVACDTIVGREANCRRDSYPDVFADCALANEPVRS